MQISKDKSETARKKIIEVSQTLFSSKGFDATRVDDIAKAAGVNKALIYYYFKSKDDILNHLIQMLLDDISVIILEFVKTTIIPMYEKGQLDIQQDCWSFVSEADAQNFHQALMNYYEKIVDYALSHRRIVRILVLESLKSGKHHNALFCLQDLIYSKEKGQFSQTLGTLDQNHIYSTDHVIFKFFFGFVPIFNFAAYFDDYVLTSKLDESEFRTSFLRAYQKMAQAFFNGRDIVL